MKKIGVAETGARPRIVLVDDDPGVRRSLQLLLNGRGFDVRSYADGEELLVDPLTDEAACLVADYRLDGVDGVDVLARLRGRGWPGRAVLITAHCTDALAARARSSGYDAVVEKPFRHGVLVETVLGLARGEGAPAR